MALAWQELGIPVIRSDISCHDAWRWVPAAPNDSAEARPLQLLGRKQDSVATPRGLMHMLRKLIYTNLDSSRPKGLELCKG